MGLSPYQNPSNMIFLTNPWIAVVALLVTCLAAIATRSLSQFSPHELKELYRLRGGTDRLGQILRHKDRVVIASESLATVAAAVFAITATCRLACDWSGEDWPGWPSAVVGVAAAMALLLAAAVWLPATIARLWSAGFLYYTWSVWRSLALLLAPLVWIARFVNTVFHRLADRGEETADEEAFEEDIRTIVTEGHREGLLEEDAREMIEGVIELGDADVAQIMTPRTDMVSMSAALPWSEMLDLVIKMGHTRIPVYGRSRDDIIGILYAKDLLPELAKPPEGRVEPWTKLLREPVFVPETKPINALLQELQASQNHMAVVLDEYGGVSGLVTMEDVLEEIVGEIVDEYDTALVDGIRDVGPGVCEALGRVHLDEINERLGLDLPEDAEYDTIAGYVFSELGHIPVVGEQLLRDDVRITVLEATRRRIERLRIEVLKPSPSE